MHGRPSAWRQIAGAQGVVRHVAGEPQEVARDALLIEYVAPDELGRNRRLVPPIVELHDLSHGLFVVRAHLATLAAAASAFTSTRAGGVQTTCVGPLTR